MDKTVLFVCSHGAARSRVAAAYFDLLAPPGWRAVSAGLEPQAQLGETAPRMLAGTEAESHLDLAAPRPFEAVPAPSRTIAIDCDATADETWNLRSLDVDASMREEIRARVQQLVAGLESDA